MIAKFNTGSLSAEGSESSSGSGGKTLLIIGGLLLAGWLGYKFVYLPYKAKKEQEKLNANNG